MMTELEGSLIAKNLIFQKIFLLPRSRWTALKDRVINVPITDEAINETIKMLPRTPNEAGLIGLELKRKIEMKRSKNVIRLLAKDHKHTRTRTHHSPFVSLLLFLFILWFK